jgi:imidazolonepropionase-like amidohydrolase
MKPQCWSLTHWICCLAALLACACAARTASKQSAGGDPPSGLVISDVTVISPERAAPLQHAHVRIRDGRIKEVSERPLEGGQKTNGTGRYLFPGLIDTHVHLAISPGFLAERDARLLFGSDTPSAELHTNPPGLNGRLEMDNWIAAGVSEAKLFRAMTIDNARVMRLDDEMGTIEPGKKANLLLLGADPLKNVKAYDAIETVFLNGRPITRETLSARHAPAARQ